LEHARCHLNARTINCWCCDLEATARDRKNIEHGVNIGAGTSIYDRANGGLAGNNRKKRLDEQILNAPERVFLTKLGLSTFSGLEIMNKARNNCAYAKFRAYRHAAFAVKNGYARR
jgi:hypothetical protein